MITRSSRVLGTSLCALVAVSTLTSCLTTPSNRRVVQDQIEALGLDDDQERCMLDKVRDDNYSDDELEQIGEENESADFDNPEWVASASEAMQEFVADLRSCLDDPEASEATEASEPTESTDESESTESTEVAAQTTG